MRLSSLTLSLFRGRQCSVTYGNLIQSLVSTRCQAAGRGKEIGCQLGSVLWTWFVLAVVLSLFGFIIVLPLSWANSPCNRTPFRMLFSTIVAFAYAVYVRSIVLRRKKRGSARLSGVAYAHGVTLFFAAASHFYGRSRLHEM